MYSNCSFEAIRSQDSPLPQNGNVRSNSCIHMMTSRSSHLIVHTHTHTHTHTTNIKVLIHLFVITLNLSPTDLYLIYIVTTWVLTVKQVISGMIDLLCPLPTSLYKHRILLSTPEWPPVGDSSLSRSSSSMSALSQKYGL